MIHLKNNGRNSCFFLSILINELQFFFPKKVPPNLRPSQYDTISTVVTLKTF